MAVLCTCDSPTSVTGGRCDVCGLPPGPFACDLCWFSFPTQEELNQHIAMENAVSWSIDQLDDDDQEPSTKAARL